MNVWIMVYRVAGIVFLILSIVVLACVFLPKCYTSRELHRRKVAMEQENAAMEARIKQLKRNQERFGSDPEFLERVAREQGRAKPGETIFKFTNEAR